MKEIPTGIFIVDGNKKVRFANDWVRDIVPERNLEKDCCRQMDTSEAIVASRLEDVVDLMERVESLDSRHTLLECINEAEGSDIMERVGEFTYQKGNKEYRFAIKQYAMQFKKEMCTAVVIDDRTSLNEAEKYRRILLASVVHDIRTPIQGILGAFENLLATQRDSKDLEHIEIGKNTCKLLTLLTYDITDMGQMEAGKLRIKSEAFSVWGVANECVSMLNFAYTEKGLKLNLVREGDSPMPVYSDKLRYTQILINLLGNALKFTTKGSVTITLSTNAAQDLIATKVRDTGIGIKTEELPHMFKLFGKLQSGASLNPNGVGLGLSICKKLAEALGGNISVHSVYGEGTEFTFSIRANSDHQGLKLKLNNSHVQEEQKTPSACGDKLPRVCNVRNELLRPALENVSANEYHEPLIVWRRNKGKNLRLS